MDRSKLSHIISTTRLLPHFSAANINTIKLCLFDQLGIETESQFLCIALNSLYKSLSQESVAIIRTKAIEIAENQSIGHQNQNRTLVSNTTDVSNARATQQQPGDMTVYKYIQQQYNDRLSKLHSDIIDYFGTFLNKQQSIEFGYLNKQLYIETQKQSYLIKRCKDPTLLINHQNLDKLFFCKSDGFNYTFPRYLELAVFGRDDKMTKMPFFDNMFRRLSVLKCYNLETLSYVPLKHVFMKNRNYYPNNESYNFIDQLNVSASLLDRDLRTIGPIKTVDRICQNFDRLNHSPDTMRCIKQLIFKSHVQCGLTQSNGPRQESIDRMNLLAKRLLIRFGSISERIDLCGSTMINIKTFDELKSIFHSNLKHIYFDVTCGVSIDIGNHDDDINTDKIKNDEVNSVYASAFESIGFKPSIASHYAAPNIVPQYSSTLTCFDKYGIRRNIKQYIIYWSPPYAFYNNFVRLTLGGGDTVDLFDKIFFQDYDKHPLLESIIIKFVDNKYLVGLARLVVYLYRHYKQLFVERKLYLAHFNKIEMHIDKIRFPTNTHELEKYPHGTNHEQFYQQDTNKEYSINNKKIEIKSKEFDQTIKSFAIVYQNIFDWLQRMQQELSRKGDDGIKDVKIIFSID